MSTIRCSTAASAASTADGSAATDASTSALTASASWAVCGDDMSARSTRELDDYACLELKLGGCRAADRRRWRVERALAHGRCSPGGAIHDDRRGAIRRLAPGCGRPVRRIAIIASASGNGKTTLSPALAKRLDVRFVEFDALVHGPSWSDTPDDELRARLEPTWPRRSLLEPGERQ